MRIALICPYAWDDPGGVQTHVRESAQRLLDRGHAVTVIAPVRCRPGEPWVRPVGRPVDVPYNASNAPIDPRPWSIGPIGDELRRFVPDVVHAHEPLAPSTSMWAMFASRAPVVGTFHSGATRARLYDVAAPVLRLIARRLKVRIAVSEVAARTAGARIGGTFEIVPNGVDVRRFAEALPTDLGPGRKLMFVGRLDERKGFPTAMDAFARVAATAPDIHLVVAGDGPDRAALDRFPDEVRERVHMLGTVPNRHLPPYSAACDVFLGAAVGGESFGIVLVEAMAAGLAVIASDIPGYIEVVRDDVDGLTVPPRDPGALAAAVRRVLDDEGLAGRLRAAGRARAAAFDWTVVIERMEALYERAAASGSPPIR